MMLGWSPGCLTDSYAAKFLRNLSFRTIGAQHGQMAINFPPWMSHDSANLER
uniref:Uncharacterized protein MANES_09G008900 n=1 Tax=Rhizophora mucronata TaxID=61149 RepID=A0A2P2N872_RHIMU